MKLLFLIAVSSFCRAAAADVTGNWSVDGSLHGTPISFDCTFQQVETRLTGSCRGYQFAVTANGSVQEGTFQFSYVYNFAGEPYKFVYTGKFTSPAEVKGDIVVSGIDGTKGEFVAKKIQ